MIQTINWIIWKLFIIYISLHLFTLNLINSEDVSSNTDHRNSSPDSVNHEVFNANLDPNGPFKFEISNETSIEINEELGEELHEIQRLLNELGRRIRETPNSANKYMKNELLISSCIIITLNLFIFMYKS
ncbi:unnamed protein product [Schistosoma rodhaini]|uniref:t-SNARE coiled-coil homology domain-containing protein n=1 Tax=Schistosoma rodhaini TaxID=6188 RepID=A0A183QII3_9TREM|nr:unnamed protein product [Schistosoma rodhaini]